MDRNPAVTMALAVVGTVVGGLLAIVGGFLVPRHVGPVSAGVVVALLSVGPYAHAIGRATRSALVGALPAVAWLGVTMFLASVRAEGDLIVTGSTDGLLFLLLGTVSSATGIGTVRAGIERDERRAAARALRREAAERAATATAEGTAGPAGEPAAEPEPGPGR